jgi:energy-converting hydrogenase Eha subunit C
MAHILVPAAAKHRILIDGADSTIHPCLFFGSFDTILDYNDEPACLAVALAIAATNRHMLGSVTGPDATWLASVRTVYIYTTQPCVRGRTVSLLRVGMMLLVAVCRSLHCSRAAVHLTPHPRFEVE